MEYEIQQIDQLSDDEVIDLTHEIIGEEIDSDLKSAQAIRSIIPLIEILFDEVKLIASELGDDESRVLIAALGYIHGITEACLVRIEKNGGEDARKFTVEALSMYAQLGHKHALLRRYIEIQKKRKVN